MKSRVTPTHPVPCEGDRILRLTRILMVAGEASGDRHASKLISEIKRRDPGCEIVAAGGEDMRAAGAELLFNLVDLAVLGSVEVLRSYFKLREIFYSLLRYIKEQRPDAVVLVDYPGFNIRLAKKIKRMGLPVRVIYYISPQIWAWGRRRKRTIGRTVDLMIVILPFEKDFYSDTDLKVEFVGHPMLDDLRVEISGEEFRRRNGIRNGAPLVAILPGSRWNEVRRHLPVMLRASDCIRKELNDIAFMICEPRPGFRRYTEDALSKCASPVKIADGNVYDLINASDLVLVASGTATLETACLLKPMVIVYKVAWPTYFLGRMLVKLPYIGLVNVIAGRRLMPELIQRQATAERLAATALALLTDRARRAEAVKELEDVRRRVGDVGASARAAEVVLGELKHASLSR